MGASGQYDISHLIEAQYEPGSKNRVLKNKLKIKTKRQINEAESIALKIAMDKTLELYDETYKFTAKDIRFIHKLWLGDIYEWAGEYRQVNLSKGDFPFAFAKQIPNLMDIFEKEILNKYTPCNFNNVEQVIQAISIVHVEFILIHPFREGNGRMARILSTLMAAQSGLPILNFEYIADRRRKEYFSAIHSGLNRDYRNMEKIFKKILDMS